MQRFNCWMGSVFLLCACQPGEPNELFTRVDSAGVTITHSLSPMWRESCSWSVGQDPSLTIGVVTGSEPYLFDQVMGVLRLRDGGWVVGNMGDNTLRFYEPSGEFRRQTGGSGGGPTEFQQIMGVERHGDLVMVRQFGLFPHKLFDEAGDYITSLTPAQVDGVRTGSVGAFIDGSILLSAWPQGRPPSPGVVLKNATFYRATETAVDSILSLPAVRYVNVDPFMVAQEFGPTPAIWVADSTFYYGWPADFDVAVYGMRGDLRQRIRREWMPLPVTEADQARYREYMLTGPSETGGPLPPRLLEQRREIADGMVFPAFHPAHGQLKRDTEGNLWIERRDRPDYRNYQMSFTAVTTEPTSWDVFDPMGAWLGTVALPSRFRAMELGADYVVGIWKDESDVEFVHVYVLTKPCEPAA